jgi:acid phosphatase
MKGATLATFLTIAASAEAQINPLEHLGGNSPFFRGPNVFDISPDAPEGCSVDQAAFSSRHGSRYPDPGAYNGWLDLSAKVFQHDCTD